MSLAVNQNAPGIGEAVASPKFRVLLENPISETPQYFWISEKIEVMVLRVDGQIRVFNSICPHMGAQMEADCKSGHLTCPWHGLRFDMRDARSCHSRYRKTTEYHAEIQGNELLIG